MHNSEISTGLRGILMMDLINVYFDEFIQRIKRGVKEGIYPFKVYTSDLCNYCMQLLSRNNIINIELETVLLVDEFIVLACYSYSEQFEHGLLKFDREFVRVGDQFYFELNPI